ncbi:MAG: imelysin family protein [Puniceicoccales bacterium]
MSRRFIALISLLMLILAVGLGGLFTYRNPGVQQYLRGRAAEAVMVDYVDNAVLKTLELIVVDMQDLQTAAAQLQADPTQQNLDDAAQAWLNAYGCWMQDVAFQFGPATQYDYHKRLATWPTETVLVGQLISEIETGELTLDARTLREEHFSGMRGLYTAQYLLFRNGQPRKVATMTPAERIYLTVVTDALVQDSIDFEAAWRGTDNMPKDKLVILEAGGFKHHLGYAYEVKYPGVPGGVYASVSVTLQEAIQDLGGAVEDIMPQVGELRDNLGQSPDAYWDRIAPYDDLLNQVKSFENGYLGGVEGFRERSISDLVAEHDEALDRLIRISIAHCEYRIKVARDSQDLSEEEQDLALRVVEGELDKLNARLAAANPMVVLDPATRPYAAYVQ